jgi:hypothetical protein
VPPKPSRSLLASCAVETPDHQPAVHQLPGQAAGGGSEFAAGPVDPAARPARRRWLPAVAIALVAAIIGAGGAVGVLYGTGRLDGPTLQYSVSVYLEHDVTADEKAAIEAALSRFHPSGGVTFESREQAFKNWQEMSKDLPKGLGTVTADTLPESFHFDTKRRWFDCNVVRVVRNLQGVDEIVVAQLPGHGYVAKITCG